MLIKNPQNMVFLEKMQATFDIIELLGLSPVLDFVDNVYESAELYKVVKMANEDFKIKVI